MLLRSSSTPLLGSLLSSESPNTKHHHHHTSETTPTSSSSFGLRRARSDGNLHALVVDPHPDDFQYYPPIRSSPSSRHANTILEPNPSFSVYQCRELEGDQEEGDGLYKSVVIEESIEGEFSFSGGNGDLGIVQNAGEIGGGASANMSSPLFLARGLGIDRLDSGLVNCGLGGSVGGGGGGSVLTGGGGGQRSDIEMYYRRMVEENPRSALFLRNYAQFLYQFKGDTQKAEEYYSRAILAEPGNGEVMSQYAKLLWEIYRDQDRASRYFEQAVQAAPQDCYVLAAYAGFLWEAEDIEGDGDGAGEGSQPQAYTGAPVSHGALASASA